MQFSPSIMKKSGSTKSNNPVSRGQFSRLLNQAGNYTRPTPTAASTYASASPSVEPTPRNSLDGQPHEALKYKLSSGLNALCLSPNRESVVVAGREVLKILDVSESHQVTESINLRSSAINWPITDVKWGNNFSRSKIATAHANGNIVIWDLEKAGRKTVERIIDDEHKRAVTRICFASTHGTFLLSASSDSTMKLWDLRDNKASARTTFEGKSDNVRDVQFNPLYSNVFAAAFENGTIQKWDIRNKAIYERKINAHNGLCLTVDWHADGRTLASGGRDKNIQVWDMMIESRKPQYTIRTMAPVAHIQWRPDNENELASCSLAIDSRVHVWDIRRSNIAKYSMEEHTTVPSGFVFLDANTLFSVSKDSFFIRNDIRNAYHLIDLLPKSGIGWNVYGDVAFAALEAPMSPLAQTQGAAREARAVDTFVDDLAIPGLLSSLQNKQPRQLPQATEAAPPQYQPPQTCGVIQFPLFNYQAFTYLAQNYVTLSEDVWAACEHNCKVALEIQKYRAAQTWKIIQLLYTHTTEDTSSHSESTTADTSMETIAADIIAAVDDTAKPNSVDAWADSQLSSKYDSGESSDDESEDLGPPNRGRRRHTHRRGPSSMTTSTTERGSDAGDSSVQGTQSVASTVIKPQEHAQDSENINGTGDINGREQEQVTALGKDNRRPIWQHQDVVENLLEYYTEQGDVQMCVTLSLVLKKFRVADDQQEEAWFHAYLDLLHRFKMWSVATEVINASQVPSVLDLNQESNDIKVNCNNCFKLVANPKGSWVCDRCHKLLNPCSICHQTVKGLYVWCQGCSHGGHLQHMQAWFVENSECPTGCGHKCGLDQTQKTALEIPK